MGKDSVLTETIQPQMTFKGRALKYSRFRSRLHQLQKWFQQE